LTSGAKVNNLEITFGSLFAGIGGFDLGFERAGMVCKWQVEINDYANRVLAKHWPHVHRERDIRTAGRHNLEPVDVICGGFPCQDISYAGQGAGLDGERSGLFFEAVRVVRELRPRIVVLENVAALLTRGLDRVLGTLAEIGYDAEWHCIPAAAVGAPHIRDRVFVIGTLNTDANSKRFCTDAEQRKEQSRPDDSRNCGTEYPSQHLGRNTDSVRCAGEELPKRSGASQSEAIRQAHGEVSAGRIEPVREDVSNANFEQSQDGRESAAPPRDSKRNAIDNVANTDEHISSKERIQWSGQFMRAGCDKGTNSAGKLTSDWSTLTRFCRMADGLPAVLHGDNQP
jgi:DNA (cytosine-5)-methyltransferase 1